MQKQSGRWVKKKYGSHFMNHMYITWWYHVLYYETQTDFDLITSDLFLQFLANGWYNSIRAFTRDAPRIIRNIVK